MVNDGSTPSAIADFAPSRKLVYLSLMIDAPATPSELTDRLDLPSRTVTRALHELEQCGHIDRHPGPADARRDVYDI